MGVRDEELNGCYAMLCEALRAWHRMQKDHPRETAAKVLKDVYGYELPFDSYSNLFLCSV